MKPIVALARVAALSLAFALCACRPNVPPPEQPPNPMPPGPVAQPPASSSGLTR